MIADDTLPVRLRAAGEVAFIDAGSLAINRFVKIADPALPGTFSTMTCIGCAVHGVTVRPRPHRDGGSDDDDSGSEDTPRWPVVGSALVIRK